MASKSSKGLGKGLDSLIPRNTEAEASAKNGTEEKDGSNGGEKETSVRITMVEPNRKQPRKSFDEDSLQELSDSIKDLFSPYWCRTEKTITRSLRENADGVLQRWQA